MELNYLERYAFIRENASRLPPEYQGELARINIELDLLYKAAIALFRRNKNEHSV